MNKSEIKNAFEVIERNLKTRRSSVFFDNGDTIYKTLKEIHNTYGTIYEYNSNKYEITFNRSGGIDETYSSDSFVVRHYLPKQIEIFNVDELLLQKEINVRSWMGNGNDIKACGIETTAFSYNDNQSIVNIVSTILDKSKFNVMIQRHESGDVTIWIDTKRFTQR